MFYPAGFPLFLIQVNQKFDMTSHPIIGYEDEGELYIPYILVQFGVFNLYDHQNNNRDCYFQIGMQPFDLKQVKNDAAELFAQRRQ